LTGRPRARRRCSANGVRDAFVLAGSSRAALLVLHRNAIASVEGRGTLPVDTALDVRERAPLLPQLHDLSLRRQTRHVSHSNTTIFFSHPRNAPSPASVPSQCPQEHVRPLGPLLPIDADFFSLFTVGRSVM
ncbi:unnamed protein product, partial [Ectocarpus sp. 12 AP-2014]